MSTFIQANNAVVEDLLSHFQFVSHAAMAQARTVLGEQLRLTMQYPQTYQTPIDQKLPDECTVASTAQYVHPWNIACALTNVCLSAKRYGGETLAVQDDLQVYAGEWMKAAGCNYPSVTVHTPNAAAAEQAPPQEEAEQLQRDPDALDPKPGRLPDPSITATRTGQTGRPQKSPFEKKVVMRKKIAAAPFWWEHLQVSAPRVLVRSPSAALDESSDGAGPVQSYMVLLMVLEQALAPVPRDVTVGELHDYITAVQKQVKASEHAEAINQLRDFLFRDFS